MATTKHRPRLQKGAARQVKTQEVDLPDLDASVVIQAPPVRVLREMQGDDVDPFDASLTLVAGALVEPALTVEELRAEVQEWPAGAWLELQQAVMKIAGMNREALRDAQRSFPGPAD